MHSVGPFAKRTIVGAFLRCINPFASATSPGTDDADSARFSGRTWPVAGRMAAPSTRPLEPYHRGPLMLCTRASASLNLSTACPAASSVGG